MEMKKLIEDCKEFVYETMTCDKCKWCVSGGEFENDWCDNRSLSAHLPTGTLVSADFGCNRFEEKMAVLEGK